MFKFIKHERDQIGDFQKRVLIHIPIGFLIGLTSIIPFENGRLGKLFSKYEESEDKWVSDQAWKDYYGSMIGCAIAESLILVAIILFIWRVLL